MSNDKYAKGFIDKMGLKRISAFLNITGNPYYKPEYQSQKVR